MRYLSRNTQQCRVSGQLPDTLFLRGVPGEVGARPIDLSAVSGRVRHHRDPARLRARAAGTQNRALAAAHLFPIPTGRSSHGGAAAHLLERAHRRRDPHAEHAAMDRGSSSSGSPAGLRQGATGRVDHGGARRESVALLLCSQRNVARCCHSTLKSSMYASGGSGWRHFFGCCTHTHASHRFHQLVRELNRCSQKI